MEVGLILMHQNCYKKVIKSKSSKLIEKNQKKRMLRSDSKCKLGSEQTGADFYSPVTHQVEQEFSYEIEIQKQYLQRLKIQRQKIEGLYNKYDLLLSQMKKKDSVIKEKQDRVKLMDCKLKELELTCQELSFFRQENRQIINENMALKNRIIILENENLEIIEQIKIKESLVNDQKNQMENINEQLQDKIKSITQKITISQQQYAQAIELERQRIQTIKSDYMNQASSLNTEVTLLKNQIMKKDEIVHMLKLDVEFLQQKLSDQQENYAVYLKDLEVKIEKNQKDKKIQIKNLKDNIEEKSLEISTLESKIVAFKNQLELKELEIEDSKKVLRQQKKVFEDDIFQVKTQMNNQKIYFREQLMYCQNHIEKLQKKLNESLKREKELGERIKRFQTNEAAKRNLRQIERQEMEKISKILSYQ